MLCFQNIKHNITNQLNLHAAVVAIVQLSPLGVTETEKYGGDKVARLEKQQVWVEPVRDRQNKAVSTEPELKGRWLSVGELKQRHGDSLISSRAPQTWTGHSLSWALPLKRSTAAVWKPAEGTRSAPTFTRVAWSQLYPADGRVASDFNTAAQVQKICDNLALSVSFAARAVGE